MKIKTLVIFAILICHFSLSVCADEISHSVGETSIYLNNVQPEQLETNEPYDENTKSYKLKIEKDYRITPQNIHLYNDFNPYQSHSTTFTRQKQVGDFSFGSKQNGTISPNSYTQTSTLFTKYQKDKFSINTSYQSGGLMSMSQSKKGTFEVAPQYQLNEHFSLQNKYSKNMLDKTYKNEMVFSIKPFEDSRMNFDIGAGQVYSEAAMPTRSQLNFSTKFHF